MEKCNIMNTALKGTIQPQETRTPKSQPQRTNFSSNDRGVFVKAGVVTYRFDGQGGYNTTGDTTNTNIKMTDEGILTITGKDNGTVILKPGEQKEGSAITYDANTRTTQLVDIQQATVLDAETEGHNRFILSNSSNVRVDLDSTYNPETGQVAPNATGDNDAVAITDNSSGITGQGTDFYIQRNQQDTNPFFMEGNKGFSNGDTRGFNIDK